MKKWTLLQLTLDNSNSQEEQGDYQDKTQTLFKTMIARVFLLDFLSIQVIESKLCLWISQILSSNLTKTLSKILEELYFPLSHH